jgi:hypothetical protein
MSKKIMVRKAADNEYLHKDFHGALNLALEYLRKRFGNGAVRAYLRQYAGTFHAPLTRQLRRRGLSALQKYIEEIYRLEGATVRVTRAKDELVFNTEYCPAVRHIRKMKLAVSPLFKETESAIYGAICENTPYRHELISYDKKTGRSIQRFYSASQPKTMLRRNSARLHRRKK